MRHGAVTDMQQGFAALLLLVVAKDRAGGFISVGMPIIWRHFHRVRSRLLFKVWSGLYSVVPHLSRFPTSEGIPACPAIPEFDINLQRQGSNLLHLAPDSSIGRLICWFALRKEKNHSALAPPCYASRCCLTGINDSLKSLTTLG